MATDRYLFFFSFLPFIRDRSPECPHRQASFTVKGSPPRPFTMLLLIQEHHDLSLPNIFPYPSWELASPPTRYRWHEIEYRVARIATGASASPGYLFYAANIVQYTPTPCWVPVSPAPDAVQGLLPNHRGKERAKMDKDGLPASPIFSRVGSNGPPQDLVTWFCLGIVEIRKLCDCQL